MPSTLDPIDPWKTCCASIPKEIYNPLRKHGIVSARCDKLSECLTRNDLLDVMIEYLCPICGFLVRKASKGLNPDNVLDRARANHHMIGECPFGKKVLIALVKCVGCRAGFRSEREHANYKCR